jgi:exopolyphosphatase/pppGpp-phosphohydrolase
VSEPVSELRRRTQAMDDRLEEMARAVIRAHLDLSSPENASFLASPDAREQHQTQWHQWGILTHTRRFLRHYDEDIPRYLREWGMFQQVDDILRRCIDGASRWELLRAAILLHDIGKFSARTVGRKRFHFAHHEEQSGDIIRDELDLPGFGFTPAQIAYIACTAQDHFVLGLLRKAARERGEYDQTFPATGIFHSLSLRIKAEHPDDYVEIGVLFLGDSLAKVDPASGPERAVSQYDVNIAVAREYLRIVLDSPAID